MLNNLSKSVSSRFWNYSMGKNLEVCLNADDHINIANNVKTAFRAGARRIELCGAMHLAGLSPAAGEIAAKHCRQMVSYLSWLGQSRITLTLTLRYLKR